MRKRPAIVAALLILIGGVGFAAKHVYDPSEPAAASVPAPAVPVIAGKVASRDVPIYLRGVGTVIAYNNVVVHSLISGPITKIAFTQGQTVKKGDLLAQIDPDPYQAQIDQITATRDRDQAQLVNAQANLDRYTPLLAKGFATSQLVATQKAQVIQLQATIKADEALLRAAQVNLSYTRLTSPIDGVTGIRQIDEGNIIHPTDTFGLVDVAQIQPISLIFTLPEETLPQIQQQMAKGPLTVLAYSQDDKTKLDEGKLLLVDNQIVQTTGTIRLRATFPNTGKQLWPGALVNARLLLDTRTGGLTIAGSAVQQGPNGSYVYVIAPDGTAQMQPVTVAQLSGGQALIDSGLDANETVVVDGQYRLVQGSRVQVLEGKAADEAALQSAVQQAIP
ncbi:multidrug transporter [Mesorhizobium sp. 113-1-2]|uniref:efflux RND transporter periplasmic adaptor subunit n=1 Tax=Mesorhizobium sp. 113-1-2 TaxID=2744515 RepID=UPI00192936FF|nr:efflux RND transporter periplasmic adaptor subunit [Mesorhizobium sp. 113-1-2]BCG70761.1 multidrug transporter [Mesorhizobium sp. 113-1-2]